MSVSKSCLANTGQRAKKRDHHKYKRAHTSLDGVTTVEKDLFYMFFFAVCVSSRALHLLVDMANKAFADYLFTVRVQYPEVLYFCKVT